MTPLELRCVEAMARAVIGCGFPPGGVWVDATIANHTPKWFEGRKAMAECALRALLSELNTAGWQVVPKQTTREMVTAAIDRPADPDAIMYGPIYRAMLAAAPKPFEGGE